MTNVIQLGVGNAVPGIPAGTTYPQTNRISAFGGWNAEDGVPYELLTEWHRTPCPPHL